MSLFTNLPEDLQREIGYLLSYKNLQKIPSPSCIHKEDDIFWKIKVCKYMGEKPTYKNIYEDYRFQERYILDWNQTEIDDYINEPEAKRYINRKDKYGKTLFHYYVYSDKKIQMLIKNGANVNIPDKGGNTPLFMIDGNDRVEITGLLIEAGADVNYQEPYFGNTILHINCSYRHPNLKIIEMFLQAGANLNIKNNKGDTAYDVARNNMFNDDILVPLLEKYM